MYADANAGARVQGITGTGYISVLGVWCLVFGVWRLDEKPTPTAHLVEMLFDTHVGQPLLQERDQHARRDLQ